MSKQFKPFVSVVVPVFNDRERLKTCLEALEHQTYPKNLYEVIVVDNGSDERIEDVVIQFGQAFATYEDYPGSYAARNKGILLAKGEVIAFTDADCIPASNWIEKGVANLLRVPNCGLVAGKVKLLFKNPDKPNAVELFESIHWWRSQKEAVEQHKYGATANMFTFRSVIDNVGVFDRTLKSHGDIEWGRRIHNSGYKQVYTDDAYVYHPLRASLGQFAKKVVRLVGGSLDLKKKKSYPLKDFFEDLAEDLKPPFKVFAYTCTHEKLSSNIQKIQYVFIHIFVKYLRAWERIRLQVGGSSRRG